MNYAKIEVSITVDESKLTQEQQAQSDKADVDIRESHPLDDGIDDLRDTIEQTALQSFRYLGDGIKAVSISVD